MPVSLRGYTQGTKVAGSGSLAWPAGTVAGDLALVHCGGSQSGTGPQRQGWTAVGHKTWWKILTAADLTAALPVIASHAKLQTFAGSGGVGRTSSQPGVTIASAGSGLWLDGQRQGSGIAPSTYRLGTEWTDESGWSQAAYYMSVGAGYQALPSPASGSQWQAYELLPVSAAGAPTLLAPAEAERMNWTTTRTFAWRHESALPQIGFRMRAQWTDPTLGPQTRWLEVSGLQPESSVEVGIASADSSVTMQPPSVGVISWSVATQTSAGWGPYSSPRLLYADLPPDIDSLTVTSAAGDLSPTVDWDASEGIAAGSATELTGYRIRVTPAASTSPDQGTVYDSGTVHSTAHPVDVPAVTPWVNGATYKVWLTLSQTGGMTSTATSSPFTVSWTPPVAPTISAVADDPPMVTVSSLVVGRSVQIEQQLDGATWAPLVTRTATATTMTVGSPLALTGGTVSFRARQASIVDGAPMWSGWVSVTITVPVVCGSYLVDDADRSVYLKVEWLSDADRGMVQGIRTSYGLGATSARVDMTPEAGQRGTLVLQCFDKAMRDALLAWLDARRVWWVVPPPDEGVPLPPVRVARVTPRSWERRHQTALSSIYDVPIQWVEQ